MASKKCPVIILTGFLGAGKTTLVKNILTKMHGKKQAIVENEQGAEGIDNTIIEDNMKTYMEDNVVEMLNGCICCTVRKDLSEVLKKFIDNKLVDSLDGVIVETTGLADPSPVVSTFWLYEDVAERQLLDGVVTVVDALNVEYHLDKKVEDGATNESVQQIAFANKLLLNKIDLVKPEDLDRVESRIKAINNMCPIQRTKQAEIDMAEIIELNAFDMTKIEDNLNKEIEISHKKDEHHHDEHDCDDDCHDDDHHHHEHEHEHEKKDHHEHKHDSGIGSISIVFEGNVMQTQLQQFFGELIKKQSMDLYRQKGVISVAGVENKFIFQGVHMIFDKDIGEKWKDDEKRICRLVFIGKNLDEEHIKAGIELCKAVEPRFPLDAKVECNMGQRWGKGVVIAHWWEGHPQQIKLDSGETIYAPADDDRVIRMQKL